MAITLEAFPSANTHNDRRYPHPVLNVSVSGDWIDTGLDTTSTDADDFSVALAATTNSFEIPAGATTVLLMERATASGSTGAVDVAFGDRNSVMSLPLAADGTRFTFTGHVQTNTASAYYTSQPLAVDVLGNYKLVVLRAVAGRGDLFYKWL